MGYKRMSPGSEGYCGRAENLRTLVIERIGIIAIAAYETLLTQRQRDSVELVSQASVHDRVLLHRFSFFYP